MGRCKLFFLLSCWTFVLSCGGDDSDDSPVLAGVGEQVLRLDDIRDIFAGSRLKYEDSINLLKEHVNRWINETILMQHGRANMPDISDKVDHKANDFKRSLYIYEYERYYVKQHLDTVVPLAEMQTYYKDNARDFALKDYILKVFYVKLPENHPDRARIKTQMRSGKNEDLLKVEEFARTGADNYFDGHDSWIYMDDLLREVPAKVADKTQFLKNNTFIEVAQDGYLYYVLIFEYKLKDDLSPFQLEKENIRNRILHTRSAELVEKMRKDVINRGHREMEISNYVSK